MKLIELVEVMNPFQLFAIVEDETGYPLYTGYPGRFRPDEIDDIDILCVEQVAHGSDVTLVYVYKDSEVNANG